MLMNHEEAEKYLDELIAKKFPELLKPLTKKELNDFYEWINGKIDIEEEKTNG